MLHGLHTVCTHLMMCIHMYMNCQKIFYSDLLPPTARIARCRKDSAAWRRETTTTPTHWLWSEGFKVAQTFPSPILQPCRFDSHLTTQNSQSQQLKAVRQGGQLQTNMKCGCWKGQPLEQTGPILYMYKQSAVHIYYQIPSAICQTLPVPVPRTHLNTFHNSQTCSLLSIPLYR